MRSREFFEQVADALVGFAPPELGGCTVRFSVINLKAWFGDEAREHYEAQYLSDGTFEVGFHAEHRAAERNEAVLERLLAAEPEWRGVLGPDVTAGDFVGMEGGPWRRLSEVGPVPRPLDVDAALDLAERLALFAQTLEPVRRQA